MRLSVSADGQDTDIIIQSSLVSFAAYHVPKVTKTVCTIFFSRLSLPEEHKLECIVELTICYAWINNRHEALSTTSTNGRAIVAFHLWFQLSSFDWKINQLPDDHVNEIVLTSRIWFHAKLTFGRQETPEILSSQTHGSAIIPASYEMVQMSSLLFCRFCIT